MGKNYYLIGSKYGYNSDVDVFPKMVQKGAVCVGFASKYNLSKLVGKDEDEIIEYLLEKGEESSSYSTFKYFLNLKEGDLIAIKSTGSPIRNKPNLVICGYAVVKKKNGKIYEHDPDDLGHLVYVEFIEAFIEKQLNLGGYGKTIHKIRDTGRINLVFGAYHEPEIVKKSKGVPKKNLNPHRRIINASSVVVKQAHNRLQQELFEKLKEMYGENNVKMEENFVDIKLYNEGKITFYEIKPYSTANECIREGLGQLLDYFWKDKKATQQKSKIVVVGPSKPTPAEKRYINFIKKGLDIEFDYEWLEVRRKKI